MVRKLLLVIWLGLLLWQANGGLAVFGYPISAALPEETADGQTVRVHYFTRWRFEQHPGAEMRLSPLGVTALQRPVSSASAIA